MRTKEVNRLAAGVTGTEVRASIDAVRGETRRAERARAAADSGTNRSASGSARAARAAHDHTRHRRGDDRGADRRALRQVLHQRAPSSGLRRAGAEDRSNRARSAAAAASRRSGRDDCGRPSTFRPSPRCGGIPRSRRAPRLHAAGKAPDGDHRRRHAETHASRVRGTQIRNRRANRRAPPLTFNAVSPRSRTSAVTC